MNKTWREEYWDTMDTHEKICFVLIWILMVPVFWGVWFYGLYKLVK